MVTITQQKNSVYVLSKRINHDQKKPFPTAKLELCFKLSDNYNRQYDKCELLQRAF